MATKTKKTPKPKPLRKIKRKQPAPSSMTVEEMEAELLLIEQEELKLLEIEAQYINSHLWEYFNQFGWQSRADDLIRKKLIIIAPAPNKIGKTAKVCCVIAEWMTGYQAWNPVDADYPGAVKAGNGKYYKPSTLGITPPVKGRLTGEDWNHHLGQTVVPELKKWLPMDEFTTKKNTNGVEYFWMHKPTGSTLELLTHAMEDSLYESWFGHFWIPDEPPPEKKFNAMSRGLFGNRGKILIPTTPLKEAWMLDKLILTNRTDVGVVDDLCCLDNEIFYDHDDKILTEMGLTGKRSRFWREMEGQKKTYYDLVMRWELYIGDEDERAGAKPDDCGVSAERFLLEVVPEDKHHLIMDLYFLKFAKDTPLDEKASRFFGLFKKLVGLVVKEFNRSKHIRPADGDIPANWIVSFQIDFHLSKPQAILFFATSERNNHYVIHEIWENMPPEDIASRIITLKRTKGWNIEYGEIDPLSKGDDKYMKNRDEEASDSFTIISDLLEDEGIELGVASKDKKSGFASIKSALKGPNKIPTLYFLDNLQSVEHDMDGVVHEIQRLCYDDNGEIEKKDDHFMECLYRFMNMNVEYVEHKKGSYCHERSGSGNGGDGPW